MKYAIIEALKYVVVGFVYGTVGMTIGLLIVNCTVAHASGFKESTHISYKIKNEGSLAPREAHYIRQTAKERKNNGFTLE